MKKKRRENREDGIQLTKNPNKLILGGRIKHKFKRSLINKQPIDSEKHLLIFDLK